MDASNIEAIAQRVLRWPEKRRWDTKDKDRRFKALFGAQSSIVATLWNMLIENNNGDLDDGKPEHLLWALVFLKVYGTEEVNCSIVGWPCTKTFSRWAWYFVGKIADLKDVVIQLDDRFEGLGEVANSNAFISLDGTDCPTFEPKPWNSGMFSEKFNGPGVKYEVGVCIRTSKIVWIGGPHRAGKNDNTVFQYELQALLFDDEAIECDMGYGGDARLKTPQLGKDTKEREMKSEVRAQHEAVNGRLKIFNVLNTHFRHMGRDRAEMMEKHKSCFYAVAVITQLKFMAGDKIFSRELEYDVTYM